MWLDTEATRLDVAGAVREARAQGTEFVRWGRWQIEVSEDTLLVAGRVIDLVRQAVLIPGTDEVVEGPPLARCPRPGCHRRARVLWALPWNETGIACRACAGVRYASASTSDPVDRARLALDRLKARGGSRPSRGQHGATIERREQRLAKARARLEAALEASFRRAARWSATASEVAALEHAAGAPRPSSDDAKR